MTKQHVVQLTTAERAEVTRILRQGTSPAFAQRRARILLHADIGVAGPRLTDRDIAAAVAVDVRTVVRVRAQFVRDGLPATLTPRRRFDRRPRKLDAAAETRLIAVACSAPPPGHARWSLRMLSARLVELEIVDHIAPETVRQTLKKTH